MYRYTYYCLPNKERERHFTLEDYIFGRVTENDLKEGGSDTTRTRTFVHDNFAGDPFGRFESYEKKFQRQIRRTYDLYNLTEKVREIANKYESLSDKDLNEYYRTWRIPKKKGGYRTLCQATGMLAEAHKEIANLLNGDYLRPKQFISEEGFQAIKPRTYHTTAYAYMAGRGVRPCLEKHANATYRDGEKGARWMLQLDFHDFFGSTTLNFVNKQLKMIFPWNYVYESAPDEMEFLMSLCFLNGGLPQGSKVSPVITNLMMIPIDHKIANALWKWKSKDKEDNEVRRCFMYTRYADDIQISAEKKFHIKPIIEFILGVLKEFEAPFELNQQKTKFTSRAGGIWLFGMMYGQDGEIRIGHNTKKNLRSQLCHYIDDFKNGARWALSEVQKMNGIISWYNSVEEGYITTLFHNMDRKYHCNLREMIKADLKGI